MRFIYTSWIQLRQYQHNTKASLTQDAEANKSAGGKENRQAARVRVNEAFTRVSPETPQSNPSAQTPLRDWNLSRGSSVPGKDSS
ncbi:hypothetical protein BaRGS_00023479 [Batillaria attramentaria]|uniref:Uncharacterized protein n=1 Tax=Batillaria attramentaria TaxID=370345 RepID=A0ABD0KDI7_9CAEN